jgi:hypothetical protein
MQSVQKRTLRVLNAPGCAFLKIESVIHCIADQAITVQGFFREIREALSSDRAIELRLQIVGF